MKAIQVGSYDPIRRTVYGRWGEFQILNPLFSLQTIHEFNGLVEETLIRRRLIRPDLDEYFNRWGDNPSVIPML